MRPGKTGKPTKSRLKDLTESSLFDDLRDPHFAARYLEEVLRDGSPAAFLAAVRYVAQANGGMRRLAGRTSLGRESLYKSLSEGGNPRFSTLQSVLKGVDLRFSVVPRRKGKSACGRG